MDLNYAKAYMKERMDEAQSRRLLAEVRAVEFNEARTPRMEMFLGSVRQRMNPGRGPAREAHSLEPACCVT